MRRLETLIANYMKNCESIKKKNKKTLKNYRIDLAQFQAFMREYPDFEDKTAINDYISYLHDQYKPRTTKRKIAALKAFFHHLVYEEIITLNPFDKINVKFREQQILPRTIPEATIANFISTMYKQKSLANTTYQYNAIPRDITRLLSYFFPQTSESRNCVP